MEVEFKAWPKIPRGKGQAITVTEKLDGTNACIIVEDGKIVAVQSRKRFITPESDNYGFAQWVKENNDELLGLGDGYHYGEWYGLGIQKNPHNAVGKRFALFNTFRWGDHNPNTPKCVEVVPVLYTGRINNTPDYYMDHLIRQAEVGGWKPEGIVIYYHNTKALEKYTFKTPDGKWLKEK